MWLPCHHHHQDGHQWKQQRSQERHVIPWETWWHQEKASRAQMPQELHRDSSTRIKKKVRNVRMSFVMYRFCICLKACVIIRSRGTQVGVTQFLLIAKIPCHSRLLEESRTPLDKIDGQSERVFEELDWVLLKVVKESDHSHCSHDLPWGGTSKETVLRSTLQYVSIQGMMKKIPGPFDPPFASLPSLKMTALSYSCTTYFRVIMFIRRVK